MKINFFLNGSQYRVYNKLTIKQILTYFNFSNKFFIIEYNNVIYKQNYYKSKRIKTGDKIEVISIVGGG